MLKCGYYGREGVFMDIVLYVLLGLVAAILGFILFIVIMWGSQMR